MQSSMSYLFSAKTLAHGLESGLLLLKEEAPTTLQIALALLEEADLKDQNLPALMQAYTQAFLFGKKAQMEALAPLLAQALRENHEALDQLLGRFAHSSHDLRRFQSSSEVRASVATALKRRSEPTPSAVAFGQTLPGVSPPRRKKEPAQKLDGTVDAFSLRRLGASAVTGDFEACQTLREEAERGNERALEELCSAVEKCTTSLNPLRELVTLAEKKPEMQERIAKLQISPAWLEILPPQITQEVAQNNFETLNLLVRARKVKIRHMSVLLDLLPGDLLHPYLSAHFQAWKSGTEAVPDDFAFALEGMALIQVSHRDYLNELAESGIQPFVEAKERVDRYFEQEDKPARTLFAVGEAEEKMRQASEIPPEVLQLKERAKGGDLSAVNALIGLGIPDGKGWWPLVELDQFFGANTFIFEAVVKRALEHPKMLGFLLVLTMHRKSNDQYTSDARSLVATVDLSNLIQSAESDANALHWVFEFANLRHPVALQEGAKLSFQLKTKFSTFEESTRFPFQHLLVDGLIEEMSAGNSDARQILAALAGIGNRYAREVFEGPLAEE